MSTLGACLIDGNSLGFAAQSANKLAVAGQQTQAIYGMVRTIRQIVMMHRVLTPIVLWDGVSWRKSIYPQYKAHRDKEAVTAHEKKAKADRDAYKSQKKHIARALRHLGVPQMVALNMEADDLAAILTKRYRAEKKKIILISGDKDWLQLVGPGVSWHDPIRDHRVNQGNFNEFTGLANPRQLVELKCLIGEPGDLGPGSGVGGIGDKSGREILHHFGSINGLLNLWIEGKVDPATGAVEGIDPSEWKAGKKVREFLDESGPGRDIFARNMRLIDLTTTERPKPHGLKLDKGLFDREAFADLCGEFAFKSILKELDTFLEPFDPAMKEEAA